MPDAKLLPSMCGLSWFLLPRPLHCLLTQLLMHQTSSLTSVFLFQFVMSGWGTGYSFRCDIVDYSQSPRAMRVSFSLGKFVAENHGEDPSDSALLDMNSE